MGNHISMKAWINLIQHKAYFELGRGVLQYGEWLIAYFGITGGGMKRTMLFAAGYAVLCYIMGWLGYHSDYVRACTEFGNRYNPFVAEMRAHLQKAKRGKL